MTVEPGFAYGVDSTRRTCEVGGCTAIHFGRGMCQRHYARWQKHGDPLVETRPILTAEERFARFTPNRGDGCWEWTGPRQGKIRYGLLCVAGRRVYAHRWSYEHFCGPIPAGHHVRHTCDNMPCVNPAHLITGTQQENNRDMVERNRNIKGERVPSAKFTREQVEEMRRLHSLGMRPMEIKEMFGVRGVYVYQLLRADLYWKSS
jgi:hypothetical protein